MDVICSGIVKHTVAFLFSAFISIIGSILLLAGSALWTVMLKKSQDINNIDVGDVDNVPFGITVDVGNGIFLMWAGFACLVVSIIPYMIRCVDAFLWLCVEFSLRFSCWVEEQNADSWLVFLCGVV